MKENIKNSIFIILFLILCIIPSAGLILFGPSEALANEARTGEVSLRNRNGEFNFSFLSDISDSLSESFALRDRFVTLWAEINTKVFVSSVDDSIIVGKNGWLYYSDTVNDYTGTGLSDGQLRSAARNLALIQEYAEKNGADFVFTIAPNKNSLYSDNMPDRIPEKHEISNAERIETYLDEFSVNYADLFEAFNAEDEILYFSTDSHWNSRGAALGADVLLSTANRESSFFQAEFDAGEEHAGDLYGMLYPAGSFREPDTVYKGGFTFTTEKNTNGGNALNISSSCENGSENLLCWRDSFGISLYPYLAEYFSNAKFSRSVTYDLMELNAGETDVVFIELVERNLDYILKNMAVYPAPQRELPEYDTSEKKLSVSVEEGKSAAAENMVRISATVTDDVYDEGTRAYIRYAGRCFEAAVLYDENGTEICVWTNDCTSGTEDDIIIFCEKNGSITAYNAC